MIVQSTATLADWVAIYGAVLSSVIAIVAVVRYVAQKLRSRKERDKFHTELYFLGKIDRSTKQVHPIVVVLLANIGTQRISLKSLDYEGITENGLKVTGGMGWYEQPEELYGIRNRLLPLVLEGGQTADLPMVEIGVLTRVRQLKLWLTDFDDHRYYIEDRDIENVRRDVERFVNSNQAKAER